MRFNVTISQCHCTTKISGERVGEEALSIAGQNGTT
jgi:hypothetical protein